jgi:hypothetical protein
MYTYATTYLRENPFLEIHPKETSLTALSFLSFYYYAGIW